MTRIKQIVVTYLETNLLYYYVLICSSRQNTSEGKSFTMSQEKTGIYTFCSIHTPHIYKIAPVQFSNLLNISLTVINS